MTIKYSQLGVQHYLPTKCYGSYTIFAFRNLIKIQLIAYGWDLKGKRVYSVLNRVQNIGHKAQIQNSKTAISEAAWKAALYQFLTTNFNSSSQWQHLWCPRTPANYRQVQKVSCLNAKQETNHSQNNGGEKSPSGRHHQPKIHQHRAVLPILCSFLHLQSLQLMNASLDKKLTMFTHWHTTPSKLHMIHYTMIQGKLDARLPP